MADEAKNGIGMLLALGKPKSGGQAPIEEPALEPEEDLEASSTSAASDEVFNALKADDRVAFESALSRFVRVVSGAPQGEE